MKKPNVILKLAVIASSVVLIAGFVAYRAGAFNWSKPASTQPVDPAAKDSGSWLEIPTVMSGSKSTFTPSTMPPIEKVRPSTDSPSAIMGSSKSLAPLIPASSSKPGSQAPAETQQSKLPQK